jgi:hypothetical protein
MAQHMQSPCPISTPSTAVIEANEATPNLLGLPPELREIIYSSTEKFAHDGDADNLPLSCRKMWCQFVEIKTRKFKAKAQTIEAMTHVTLLTLSPRLTSPTLPSLILFNCYVTLTPGFDRGLVSLLYGLPLGKLQIKIVAHRRDVAWKCIGLLTGAVQLKAPQGVFAQPKALILELIWETQSGQLSKIRDLPEKHNIKLDKSVWDKLPRRWRRLQEFPMKDDCWPDATFDSHPRSECGSIKYRIPMEWPRKKSFVFDSLHVEWLNYHKSLYPYVESVKSTLDEYQKHAEQSKS